MPLTELAIQTCLGWTDYVAEVGLFTNYGVEVTGGLYIRQPVTFGPVSNGSKLSREVLTFTLTGVVTVCSYGLFDGIGNLLARMPHCSSVSTNPPQPCFFIDLETGWIDAPGHTLAVGQHIVFISGQEDQTNTYLDAQYSPLTVQGITYPSLPPRIVADQRTYGVLYAWYVAEVATDQFRVMLYQDDPNGLYFTTWGWGFYQRLDQAVFPGGGTLQINSIRVTEFG